MGEAKNRGSATDRMTDAKTKLLGDDPFAEAYEVIFEMVETVYGQAGGITHQLIGLDFKDGKVSGVNTLPIQSDNAIANIPLTVEQMLMKWPIVAHVCEAWEAPPEGMKASEHPDRRDIVSIMIHSMDAAKAASCLVNNSKRTVVKATLIALDKIGGRLGRKFETRH
jgi:hypothetical protein